MTQIPDGIRLYADEHGKEWLLCWVGDNTLGYADGCRGAVPRSTPLVVRFDACLEFEAVKFAQKMRADGWKQVEVKQ